MAKNPNPNLPEELLIEIFSRLPTKSVGKFRCLSKPWRAQLTSPSFIKSHLTHKPHKEDLLLVSAYNSLHIMSTIKDGVFAKEVDLSNSFYVVVGSCNGLVLLLNEEEDLILINPITHEQVQVPHSPLALPKKDRCRMHGFGYDSSTDDYKILTLSHCGVDNGADIYVDVYSLKLGVWQRLPSSSYEPVPPFPLPGASPGAFVNGAVHWLAQRKESGNRIVIAAFDLVSEEFYEIPSPVVTEYRGDKVIVFEGSLCLMDTHSCSRVTYSWMLKEYGNEKSWTKVTYNESNVFKPLCYIGNEDHLLVSDSNDLLLYNFELASWSNFDVDPVECAFMDGCTFTDSLLSPAFNNEIGGNILLSP